MSEKQYVIFDLDNCLSDDERRMPLIDWSADNPNDRYHAYHAAGICDNAANVDRFSLQMALGRVPIFITSRPEKFRKNTERWILNITGVAPIRVHMRANDDHRPSADHKAEVAAKLLKEGIKIVHAFDDREDIVAAYEALGIPATVLKIHDTDAYRPPRDVLFPFPRTAEPALPPPAQPAARPQTVAQTPADALEGMAATFRERNPAYGENYRRVGLLIAAFFPNGPPPELVLSPRWHSFHMILAKLGRFANSGLKHVDSIHDVGVYAAMIETLMKE